MITPSFGLTATERVLPRLALDWTKGLAQLGVDVARAGVATFVGSNGLIQSASANTQRIDYSTGVAGLLIEESRANLFTRSEDFSNAVWTKIRSTVTTNAIIAPDGTLTADKLVENTDNNSHLFLRDATLTANTTYTYSIYVKSSERNVFIETRFAANWTAYVGARFDLTTGTVAAGTGKIESLGDGWYRCSITATFGASTTTGGFATYIVSGTAISYTGNGTSGIFIWGAQLEAGAFPTSYIPTVASTVTRNADVATMTGTNFSDWFNLSAGTFFINTDAQSGDVLLTAGTYTLFADATALKKYATTYTADPSATELVFGNGTIQKISYYKQALIAAELAALTA